MTNRGQIIRSSTKGAVPAAGTRAGGELWTNFPDLQLGVIDTARNAQKLLAVRYFSTGADYAAGDYVIQAGQLYRARVAVTAGAFTSSQWTITGGSVLVSAAAPATPTPGDMWFDSNGGQLYVFYDDGNTQQWVVAVNQNVAGGVYLPLGGGTMSGDIVSGTVPNPTTAKGIANKGYVDAGDDAIMAALSPVVMGDNRLVNGDMRIDQRNNGASGTANGYTVDRWSFNGASVKGNWSRQGGGPAGFPYGWMFASTSAYAPVAADYFIVQQAIEADMISDFAFGAAGAQPVTLSFWLNATQPGTFSGSLQNYAGTRSYPFTFSNPTASIWTKIAITIPGDTAGAWVLSGNGGGAMLSFDLGCGPNYRAAAGAWTTGNYVGVTGSINVVAVNAARFYVTGVKLEIGSVATPFNRQSLAKSMIDCQRYYQTIGLTAFGYAQTGGNAGQMFAFNTAMRASPTVSLSAATITNGSALTAGPNASGTAVYCTVTATGSCQFSGVATASAEL